ncbi:MAG: dynamin family protein [Anaerolineae bacterium]|nr:dynamin family protein [Anaerolineae bacterium]
MIIDKPSLLARYEILRRKEFERLTALLDTLGRIDGLPADQMDQARDALFHADHPFLIVLIGAFNTGKSSIINALVGEPILSVGATPTTQKIAILRHGPAVQRSQAGEVETIFHPAPLLEQVSLVDTPGLESIYKAHDEVTRRFLHRADIVLMVMMATQAMSASNVEYLQSLRAYGKRVIIVVNQIDAIDPEEQAALKAFVADRSKISLGFVPEVWMVSARQAWEAEQAQPRNEELWKASGFDQIEQFIREALGDSARVRQKLETPLQIARNVLMVANGQVRDQQNALADYRRSAQNVRSQMDTATREQQTTVRDAMREIDETFAEAARRGREAIHDMFEWSQVFRLGVSGVTEFLGVARVIRRFGAQTPAQTAFETRKVNEPLNQIPVLIDRIGPRLEGRDVKDVDDLIAYTRREIEQLPGGLQQKVIGKLQAPASYDRAIMRNARDELLPIVDKARTIEFKRIDLAVRNTLVFLGAYELVVVIGGIIAALALAGSQNGSWALLLVAVIVLALVGLAVLPLRGWLMEQSYGRRLIAIKTELENALERATQQQVAFGTQMRNDAVAPFMRLVETQVSQVDQLKTELEGHQQALVGLEKELGDLR